MPADPRQLLPMEACWSLDNDELDEQIATRQNLIQQMVGTLYPNILMGEILRLSYMKHASPLDRLVDMI